MSIPCDPDYLAVSAASIIASQRVLAGYLERGIEPPFPRIYTCTYCGHLTSMSPVSFEHGDHIYDWPSTCAEDDCGDAAVEEQLRRLQQLD